LQTSLQSLLRLKNHPWITAIVPDTKWGRQRSPEFAAANWTAGFKGKTTNYELQL